MGSQCWSPMNVNKLKERTDRFLDYGIPIVVQGRWKCNGSVTESDFQTGIEEKIFLPWISVLFQKAEVFSRGLNLSTKLIGPFQGRIQMPWRGISKLFAQVSSKLITASENPQKIAPRINSPTWNAASRVIMTFPEAV